MSSVQLSDFEDKFKNPSDVLQDALNGSFLEAQRIHALRTALRGNAVLAKEVMGPGPESVKGWRGDCEAMMAGVL